MPSSRDISFSQIYDLAEKLIQIRLEFVFLLKDFVLSKLHISESPNFTFGSSNLLSERQ